MDVIKVELKEMKDKITGMERTQGRMKVGPTTRLFLVLCSFVQR